MWKNVFITLEDNIYLYWRHINIYICMYHMWKNVFITLEGNVYLYWRHVNIYL